MYCCTLQGIKDGQPKWFFPGNAIYCHAGVFDAHVHAKPKGTAGKGNPHTIASAKTAPEAAVLFDLAMTEVGFKKDLIFEHEPSLLHEVSEQHAALHHGMYLVACVLLFYTEITIAVPLPVCNCCCLDGF